MIDITDINFEEYFKLFERQLKKCSFVALDCEFTSLPLKRGETSFQDSGADRYDKIRQNINACFPLQVGLVPFTFDRDLVKYQATIYKFHVLPQFIGSFNEILTFSSSSMAFFKEINFDFNKAFYSGISYLNKTQIKVLTEQLGNGMMPDIIYSSFSNVERETIAAIYDDISRWLHQNPVGKSLIINTQSHTPKLQYFLHHDIRKVFKNTWTTDGGINSNKITISHVSEGERQRLTMLKCTLDTEFLTTLKGFSRVFCALIDAKKPIVGHNMVLDLLTCYNFFYDHLPPSYQSYKNSISSMFPCIYDTKFINCQMEKEYVPKRYSLYGLYLHLKDNPDCKGPIISLDSGQSDLDKSIKCHDAGWDAYMTGICFVNMMNIIRARKHKKDFCVGEYTFNQILTTSNIFKNKMYVPYASVQYINMDGPDPEPSNPPHLVLSMLDKKVLNLKHLFYILPTVELLQLSQYHVLIATPNYIVYDKVHNIFERMEGVKLEPYSMLKHNRWVRSLVWAGLALPLSVTLLYFFNKQIR